MDTLFTFLFVVSALANIAQLLINANKIDKIRNLEHTIKDINEYSRKKIDGLYEDSQKQSDRFVRSKRVISNLISDKYPENIKHQLESYIFAGVDESNQEIEYINKILKNK